MYPSTLARLTRLLYKSYFYFSVVIIIVSFTCHTLACYHIHTYYRTLTPIKYFSLLSFRLFHSLALARYVIFSCFRTVSIVEYNHLLSCFLLISLWLFKAFIYYLAFARSLAFSLLLSLSTCFVCCFRLVLLARLLIHSLALVIPFINFVFAYFLTFSL